MMTQVASPNAAVDELAESIELPEDVEAILASLENKADEESKPSRKKSNKPTEAKSAAPKKEEKKTADKKADAPAPAKPAKNFLEIAGLDEKAYNTNLDKTAKKVSEKVQNMRQAIEQGRQLSRYTKDAVTKLKTDGSVSGKTLVEMFKGAGLSEGTARAQAQQMTAVFKLVGLVQPDSNDNRKLVKANDKLLGELTQLAA